MCMVYLYNLKVIEDVPTTRVNVWNIVDPKERQADAKDAGTGGGTGPDVNATHVKEGWFLEFAALTFRIFRMFPLCRFHSGSKTPLDKEVRY